MSKILLGAEVYTWFMSESGKTYENKLDHMIEVISKSGFTGIEPMYVWMGDWADPVRLKEKLDEHGVQLAGIALALDWNNPEETAEEKVQADSAIALIKHFPDCVLCTVQMPTGRHDWNNAG